MGRELSTLRAAGHPWLGQTKDEPTWRRNPCGTGRFRRGERACIETTARAPRPAEETLRLLKQGRSFEEIAQIRNRNWSSVIFLVAEMVERGEIDFQSEWVGQGIFNQVAGACQRRGMERLKPIKQTLPEEITYEQIGLVGAQLPRMAPALFG